MRQYVTTEGQIVAFLYKKIFAKRYNDVIEEWRNGGYRLKNKLDSLFFNPLFVLKLHK